MAFANTGTIRIASGVLVGGVVTGMLLAMAVPTQLKRKTENWRELIGVREVSTNESAIPTYAPPQDLTPVEWQTAGQEYPPSYYQESALDAIYPDADFGYQPLTEPEALPPELMRTQDTGLAATNDDAASAAAAAKAAAGRVRTQLQMQETGGPVATPTPSMTDAA